MVFPSSTGGAALTVRLKRVTRNNKTKDVVHFMIAKPIVRQIANIYLQDSNNGTDGIMTFSLVPPKNGSMTSGGMTMNYTISVMTPM